MDWQNQCQSNEDKGPYLDNIPRDEADTKTKSLIYFSLGHEATNIFHQSNPHTEMPKCTTDDFIKQLKQIFKEVRIETFDRYQFFNCKQEINDTLEKFHSRNQRIAGKFSQQNIADPIGRLQYALARERVQENQQKMNNNNRNNIDTNPIGTADVHYVRRNNIQQRTGILPTPKTGLITDC